MSTDRQEKIKKLREYHQPMFDVIKSPDAYFTGKLAHTPEGMDDKHISLYESELSKGDVIFIEFTSADYKPVDARRMLYALYPIEDWKKHYVAHTNRNNVIQYLVPVTALSVVNSKNECKIPVEGNVYSSTPEYKLTEESVENYTNKKYTGPNGTLHIITFKNGNPYLYELYHPPLGKDGLRLYEDQLNEIIKFFKTLQ